MGAVRNKDLESSGSFVNRHQVSPVHLKFTQMDMWRVEEWPGGRRGTNVMNTHCVPDALLQIIIGIF